MHTSLTMATAAVRQLNKCRKIASFIQSLYIHNWKPSSEIVPQTVHVNGLNIHCDTVGTGPHTVLLLPGALGCSKTDFQPQLKQLNRTQFCVVAWDPPGYGSSIPPAREWPLKFAENDAHYAAGLIQALGIEPVSLVGWSDGGITSLLVATLYPDLVRKILIWGANAYVSQVDIDLYKDIRDVSRWSARMKAPFVEVYGEAYFKEHWEKWVDAIEAFFIQTGGDIISKDNLHSIKCPTLVIHGEKDALVPREHPEYLMEHLPNARFVSMPDGKHNLHLRYAEEFNQILHDFLLET